MNKYIIRSISICLVLANYCEFVVAQSPVIESPELQLSTIGEYDVEGMNSASLAQRPVCKTHCRCPSLFDEITFLFAIDGSKQPQDFGVNANLGGNASVNWGFPVFKEFGIGAQFGTGVTSSANAVRVFELLGESSFGYGQSAGPDRRGDQFDFLVAKSAAGGVLVGRQHHGRGRLGRQLH